MTTSRRRHASWLSLLVTLLPLSAGAWKTALVGSQALHARDELRSVVVAPDGDLFLGGTAGSRPLLMRADGATGEPVWMRQLSTPSAPIVDGAGDLVMAINYDDESDVEKQLLKLDGGTGAERWRASIGPDTAQTTRVFDLAAEPGGNLLVAAAVFVEDPDAASYTETETDFLVARVDGATGTELWHYDLSGVPGSFPCEPYGNPGPESSDAALAVAQAGSSVVAAGSLEHEDGYELVVVSLELETGAERWRFVAPGGTRNVWVAELLVGEDGDVLVASYDAVRKLDGETGLELWRVDGPAAALALAPGGDVLVAGLALDDPPLGQHLDIRRLDAGGELRWQRRDPGFRSGTLSISPLGDVVVAGHLPGWETARFGVARLAGDTGVEQSRQVADLEPTANGYEHGEIRGLTITPSGDVVAVGRLDRHPLTDDDMFWLRIASETGTERWRHVRAQPAFSGDRAAAIVTGSHGEIVAGGMFTNPATGRDFGVVGLSAASGGERWRREDDGGYRSTAENASVVALDGAGDALAAGTLSKFGKVGGFDGAAVLTKMNGLTGGVCWRSFVMSELERGSEGFGDLVLDDGGDVLAVGGLERRAGLLGGTVPFNEKAAMAFRFDGATGAERWRSRIGTGFAAAAERHASGDVVASVIDSASSRPYRDPYLARVDADDGRVLWRRAVAPQYAKVIGLFAQQARVVIDAADDVVAANGWDDRHEHVELIVTKVDPADGVDRWQRIFPELFEPLALVAEPTGGVLIASADAASDRIVVLAVDATGAERWRRAFDDTDGAAAALALAGSDVVVAGAVRTAGGQDVFAAKLDGTSGEPLWHRTLDGPGQGDDAITSVTVDAAGDVVLAGSSSGFFSGSDFLVVKLRGSDGGDLPVAADIPLPDTGAHCVPLTVEEPPVEPEPPDPDPTDPEPPTTGVPCLDGAGADLCSDADVCNGIETCELATGQCRAGSPLVCDDGDACTVDDACDPERGCVHRRLAGIALLRCRADGRLPIPSCAEALPRRVRRPLARLQRILARLDAAGPSAPALERIAPLCRRARRRLEQAPPRRGSGECVAAQRAVLADVCTGDAAVAE